MRSNRACLLSVPGSNNYSTSIYIRRVKRIFIGRQSFQTFKFWLIIFVGYDEDKAIFSTGSELGAVAILCSLFSYWVCMVLVLPEKPFFLVFQFLQPHDNIWRL